MPAFKKPTTAIKVHGGKAYLSARINALIDATSYTHYVEAYAGGCSVLFGHSGEGRSELINDINGKIMNFWRVIADPDLFPEFARAVALVPFARDAWSAAAHYLATVPPRKFRPGASRADVAVALAFFIVARQSYAGRMKEFATPTRSRLRGNMNADVCAYLGAVAHLPEIHARLARVFMENMDAIPLIVREDGPDTLQYLDPTYYHPTRAAPDVYEYEMSEADHVTLIRTITSGKRRGKFAVSGYRSDLYDTGLKGWRRVDIQVPNHAAGGQSKRVMTECVWMNY